MAALLIIDVQNAIDDPSWGNDRNNPDAESKFASLLRHWHAKAWPVFHVRHVSRDPQSTYRPGQPGADFKDQVRPRKGERIVEKHTNSAFIGTTLERDLRGSGFTTIVVSDATATFGLLDFAGQWRTSGEVHAMSLANLSGEYATVLTTEEVLARFG